MNRTSIIWPNGPFFLPDKVEYDKLLKKINIARNQFLMVGKYNMPLIKKDIIDINNLDVLQITKTLLNDKENAQKIIHFFTYDWLFDNVYEKPEKAIEKLEQYYALMTPDFSIYEEMPLSVQIFNTFKNRWCGAYWQSLGLRVIPTIEWGNTNSFEFCFDGVEKGSVVAISTYARKLDNNYIIGYNEMLKRINPSTIICYGDKTAEMKGNIIEVSPFDTKELIEKMGLKTFLEKYENGTLYPTR